MSIQFTLHAHWISFFFFILASHIYRPWMPFAIQKMSSAWNINVDLTTTISFMFPFYSVILKYFLYGDDDDDDCGWILRQDSFFMIHICCLLILLVHILIVSWINYAVFIVHRAYKNSMFSLSHSPTREGSL